MRQEDKELLLKDICARLPYGVKGIAKTYKGEKVGKIISVSTKNNIILGELYNGKECFWLDYGSFTPYLRPMTSMCEDEKIELKEYLGAEEVGCDGFGYIEGGTLEDYISETPYSLCNYVINWLNSHHFDYRRLIEKGLALEAPEGMYGKEEQQ